MYHIGLRKKNYNYRICCSIDISIAKRMYILIDVRGA